MNPRLFKGDMQRRIYYCSERVNDHYLIQSIAEGEHQEKEVLGVHDFDCYEKRCC